MGNLSVSSVFPPLHFWVACLNLMPLEVAVGSRNEWKFHSRFGVPIVTVRRPVKMQHVKVFITDLVKSLKHWEPIQASEHPQFKWLQGPVYLNRYAKFIAIPQTTHVKNNACFTSDLNCSLILSWGWLALSAWANRWHEELFDAATRMQLIFYKKLVVTVSLRSCGLWRFVVFVISVVFVKGDPHPNHRFGKP